MILQNGERKSREFSAWKFLCWKLRILDLETRQIRYSESICCIIWTRDLREFEKHHQRFLHLEFFSKTITCNPLLHLKWRELNKWYTALCKCEHYDSSSMSHINTIGDISEKKKSLNTTNSRLICIEHLSEIGLYLEESVRKRHSWSCLDNSILDNTGSSPLLFEDSKTNRRKSWIKSEDYHNRKQITNYELRITNYELRITNYELRITNYELRIL